MSSLPLHPAIVHIPLALALVLPPLAIGIVWAWRRGWLPSRAFIVVVALQGVLVLGAVASLNTGEREEERVERVVAEPAIEAHEEAAQRFTAVAGLVLLVGLMPVFARPEKLKRALAIGTVAGTFVVAGLALDAGKKGGELVYRHGAAAAYLPAPGAAPAAVGKVSDHQRDD